MLWMSLSKRFCQRCHNFVYFDQQTCASHTVCWSKSSFLAFISCKKSLHLFLNFQTKKEEKWLKIRKNVLKCQKNISTSTQKPVKIHNICSQRKPSMEAYYTNYQHRLGDSSRQNLNIWAVCIISKQITLLLFIIRNQLFIFLVILIFFFCIVGLLVS